MIAIKLISAAQLLLLVIAVCGGFMANEYSKRYRSTCDRIMLYFTASVACTLTLFIIL